MLSGQLRAWSQRTEASGSYCINKFPGQFASQLAETSTDKAFSSCLDDLSPPTLPYHRTPALPHHHTPFKSNHALLGTPSIAVRPVYASLQSTYAVPSRPSCIPPTFSTTHPLCPTTPIEACQGRGRPEIAQPGIDAYVAVRWGFRVRRDGRTIARRRLRGLHPHYRSIARRRLVNDVLPIRAHLRSSSPC